MGLFRSWGLFSPCKLLARSRLDVLGEGGVGGGVVETVVSGCRTIHCFNKRDLYIRCP